MDELMALAEAMSELGEQMSDMSVARLTEGSKRKAQTTSAARRGQRKKAQKGVKVHQVPKVALETAKLLADGDMSRVKIQPDGSVVVVNG